jgi:chromosome segregation ATPase
MEKEKEAYHLQASYTFGECCKVLDVDFKTFKGWLSKDGVQSSNSSYDTRVKYLTVEQVQTLAERHGRPWPPLREEEPEQITAVAAKRLMEQIANATRQAKELRAELKIIHQQEGLAPFREEIAAQLDVIRQAQAEIAESWKNTHKSLDAITLLQEHQKFEFMQHLHKLLESINDDEQQIEELQKTHQDQAGKLDTFLEASGQQAEQLAAIQAALEKQAGKLEAIAQASEQQGQQLATLQAALDSLTANYQEHERRFSPLPARIDKQGQRYAQLTGRVDELATQAQRIEQEAQQRLEQAQEEAHERTRGMIELLQTRLQAEQEAAIEELQKEMQARMEERARELLDAIGQVEKDQARDVADTHKQAELQGQQIETAITKAEAATTTALGGQRRIDGVERRLSELAERIQADQTEREQLTRQLAERLEQPQGAAIGGPGPEGDAAPPQAAEQPPKPRRRVRTSKEKGQADQ